ncbi:hypothetical protein C8R44DRAFT_952100, partial [Mycena epipterygia]
HTPARVQRLEVLEYPTTRARIIYITSSAAHTSLISFPRSQTDRNHVHLAPFFVREKARIHVHIAFLAYLVALPLGIFIPRYLRTFTRHWFWPHAIMNFLVTGLLVFTAFALGYQTTAASGALHFTDPH